MSTRIRLQIATYGAFAVVDRVRVENGIEECGLDRLNELMTRGKAQHTHDDQRIGILLTLGRQYLHLQRALTRQTINCNQDIHRQ
jgi:hypothetical protein